MDVQSLPLGAMVGLGKAVNQAFDIFDKIYMVWTKVSLQNDFLCYWNRPTMCFDEAEPDAPSREHRAHGSNFYPTSNVSQWLNSSEPFHWWSAATPTDQPPRRMPPDGFLSLFSKEELSVIIPRKITVKTPPGSIKKHGAFVTCEQMASLPSIKELSREASISGVLAGEGDCFDHVHFFHNRNFLTRSATNCSSILQYNTTTDVCRQIVPNRYEIISPVVRLKADAELDEWHDITHGDIFVIAPENPFQPADETGFLSILNSL